MTDRAEADLTDIWAYVAVEASPTSAANLIEKIRLACTPVLHFPDAGAPRDRLANGLRAIFQGGYAIYYVHDERYVTIVRVLHGSRDMAALASSGAFR